MEIEKFESALVKKDDLIEFLKDYNPVIHTNREEGYKYLDDESVMISITNPNDSNTVLYVELSYEFTLYFDSWHTHYDVFLEDYEDLLNDIKLILNNECVVVTIYSVENEKWLGSTFIGADKIDENISPKKLLHKLYYKIKQVGEMTISFWDSQKNLCFTFDKKED